MKTKLTDNDSSIIFLISYAFVLFASIALGAISGAAYIYLSYLAPQIIYIAVIFGYLKYKKEPFLNVVSFKKPVKPVAYVLVFVVAIAIYASNLIIGISFEWLLDSLGLSVTVTLPDLNKAVNIVLSYLIICLLPAIGEELMFRGMFLTTLSKKNERFAVVMSALIFALSHLSMSQFIYQFIFGIFLAFVTIKTKNIIFAMIMHFTNNAIVITLQILLKSDPFTKATLLNAGILAIICIAGLIVLIPCLILLIKSANNNKDNTVTAKEANILHFLVRKNQKPCYNDNANYKTSSLFIGVVAVFLLAAILNSFLLNLLT